MTAVPATFQALFVDLDGLCYLNRAPAGTADSLSRLRRRGCALRFLTNDSRPSRAKLASRLQRLGLSASLEEVISAGWVSVQLLKARATRSVFVLGGDELRREVKEAGMRVYHGGTVDAVLVGSARSVGYEDIRRAALQVQRGAAFLAINGDGLRHCSSGPALAAGAFAAAVRKASAVTPEVVGMPRSPMFEAAAAGLPSGTRALMLGDAQHTSAVNIEGAHRAGLPVVLLGAEATPEPRLPWRRADAFAASFPALLELEAGQLTRWAGRMSPPPERISPCVGAVIADPHARIVLIRRRDNGLWALPTGHVEPGETYQAAVLREVEEEVGLRLDSPVLCGLYSEPGSQVVTLPDGRTEHFVTACFLLRANQGELVLAPNEVAEGGFFSVEAFPTPRVEAHVKWIREALDGSPRPVVR
ncbi:MAG TPA: NUDIX domain-containing protein [Gammaproteobacteria bacterium]|nr:NUDIX domain-containing protein [Gammaproteobacteria bacterium]